jgi:coenzyme F420-reducing hydrogenase delta subunit
MHSAAANAVTAKPIGSGNAAIAAADTAAAAAIQQPAASRQIRVMARAWRTALVEVAVNRAHPES